VRPPFSFECFGEFRHAVIATAVHAGHDLRPSVAAHSALDAVTRFREEDPFTDRLTMIGVAAVVVHRSRFEVDLNRPRDGAVYRTPDDAWGIELWDGPLPPHDIEHSLETYDEFYAELGHRLDVIADDGPFVLLDLHSYNHRRNGRDAPAGAADDNPGVNVGTGPLDRRRWGRIIDVFVDEMGRREVRGERLDVRENVRFRGGELSRWVAQRYGDRGCALAIEFKKTFMDEWTGDLDEQHLEELRLALAAAVPALVEELRCSTPT